MLSNDREGPQEKLWEWSFGEGEAGEMAGARPEGEEYMCKICPKVAFFRRNITDMN